MLAAALGLVVGVVLGTLGGGGSVLAVPALVYALGLSPHDSTTGSLVIVVASSTAGALAHGRRGHVRLGRGLAFAASGLLTSVVAAHLSANLPDLLVLTGFAAVMAAAALVTWRGAGRATVAADGPTHGSTLRTVAAGAAVGALIGVFGVGGGFLAVPALVATAGFTMADAVGTSLVVIALNASAALATRATTSHVEWSVVGPFAAAAALAAVGGQLLSTRVSAPALQRTFAALLATLAGWVLVDQLVLH
ncbi:sulfite exporter TauE/SafE family protein [Phycicoccus sp. DTK01]|uniref:sulfite exporter TauE/SafE family protein n=1 Tax=Phycicoccus sp. DTK01 TaxID=2785745 RepID=UPI001A8E5B98|nr:sulfite exporter TauE/SafE family protein [Phycicoccus sp. DTK01]